jgi:two-component system cell cycle sensor histidine kinase/response regulator CckA
MDTATSAPKKTILIVDDEPSVRLVASRILEKCGYHVLQAASGQEALEICREHRAPIHLILADLIMPGMNGVDLIKQVITLRHRVRVIYISDSYLLKQAVGEEAGLVFLNKPFTSEALTRKVAEVLNGAP